MKKDMKINKYDCFVNTLFQLCISYSESFGLWQQNGFQIDRNIITVEVKRYRVIHDLPMLTTVTVNDFLSALENDIKKSAIEKYRNSIEYKKSDFDTVITPLMDLIFGEGDYSQMEKDIIFHWIYNFKIKVLYGGNIESYNAILLNIHGPAGCGKSRLVAEMFRDLPECLKYCVADAGTFFSEAERNFYHLSRRNLIVLNEMSRLCKADSNIIKNIIDTRKEQTRIFGTQENNNAFCVASLIGTSNQPISNLINEDVDIRKYAELSIKKYDTSILKNIDFLGIFQSVNTTLISENTPTPCRFANSELYNKFCEYTTDICGANSEHIQFWKSLLTPENSGKRISVKSIFNIDDDCRSNDGLYTTWMRGTNIQRKYWKNAMQSVTITSRLGIKYGKKMNVEIEDFKGGSKRNRLNCFEMPNIVEDVE